MFELWKFLFQKEFDSKVWKDDKNARKYFYKSILSFDFSGKSKVEITKIFGEKRSNYDENKWRYFLHQNHRRNKTYYLSVYFEENRVAKTKIVFKKKLNHSTS